MWFWHRLLRFSQPFCIAFITLPCEPIHAPLDRVGTNNWNLHSVGSFNVPCAPFGNSKEPESCCEIKTRSTQYDTAFKKLPKSWCSATFASNLNFI